MGYDRISIQLMNSRRISEPSIDVVWKLISRLDLIWFHLIGICLFSTDLNSPFSGFKKWEIQMVFGGLVHCKKHSQTFKLSVVVWWLSGVITLLIGVITPIITGRGTPCRWFAFFFWLSVVCVFANSEKKHKNSSACFGYDGHGDCLCSLCKAQTIPKRMWRFHRILGIKRSQLLFPSLVGNGYWSVKIG